MTALTQMLTHEANYVVNQTAKYLSQVITLLVGYSDHHIRNSADLVNIIQDLQVPPDQKMVSAMMYCQTINRVEKILFYTLPK